MTEQILEILEKAGLIITVFAVLVIVVGFALATVRYFLQFRKLSPEENFSTFKIALGAALLLGLEILVLADVIETITVESTYQSLAVLAFIVVLRTGVSWSLALETDPGGELSQPAHATLPAPSRGWCSQCAVSGPD